MNGWEIVCPDGKVRHYPYINRGDADADVDTIAKRARCCLYPEKSALDELYGLCPGGPHEVRPVVFEPPSERGQS